ncbi:MAG: hypothetical protein M1824_006372 [Vezdaea acicularis]|nr:MAG: hypothetical protein M1824_006372 [Vezdaea acicularis]
MAGLTPPNQAISPQTPTRAFSSTFSSPGSSLRSDDEQIILEFGARYLRGGVAGENEPRCILDYGPDTQRRQGDYRQWEQGYEESWRKRRRGRRFGESHELWSMDVRNMDLALFEDQIERAIREAITK